MSSAAVTRYTVLAERHFPGPSASVSFNLREDMLMLRPRGCRLHVGRASFLLPPCGGGKSR